MAVLKTDTTHLRQIRTHAESTYPEECCGLLLGQIISDTKTLLEVLPTENAWSSEASATFTDIEAIANLAGGKRDNYVIAPEVLLKTQKQVRDRNLDIIGFYHSHPDHPAIPSEFDRVYAWQQYSYIIVSVQNGKATDLNSWKLNEHHQFQPEEITTI